MLESPTAGSPRRVFSESFAVTATNPKSIAFFVAFVPQFIDPARPWLPQITAMILAFVTLGGLNAAGYAWCPVAPAPRSRSRRPAGGWHTVPAEFSWPVGSRSWPRSIRRAATMYYRRRLAEVHAADYAQYARAAAQLLVAELEGQGGDRSRLWRR